VVAAPTSVRIPVATVVLDGDLTVPVASSGLVLFAHGSGSGRHSPRNRAVANALQQRGIGTLLVDLLSGAEAAEDEGDGRYRFNIRLLSDRLVGATDWVRRRPDLSGMRLGYFGASTGGAAAMIGATVRASVVSAVVLRGARSDLADEVAARIRCPTLLLAGERDPFIRRANEVTLTLLRCEKRLDIVPSATHLFEEPGALETVTGRTVEWFDRFLGTHGGM